jgi:hypothetical protein
MAAPRRARRVLLPLLALAAGLAGAAARDPTPLSSSVLLFYDSEYEPHYGQAISQCDLILGRAAGAGASSR